MTLRDHTVSAGDKDIPLCQGLESQFPAHLGPSSSCVALGKPLPLSGPQFPHMSYLEVSGDREGVPGNSELQRVCGLGHSESTAAARSCVQWAMGGSDGVVAVCLHVWL